MSDDSLSNRDQFALAPQQWVGRLLAPVVNPIMTGIMVGYYGWRIEDLTSLRREYRSLRGSRARPLLICANHLTMFDSFLIALALGSPWWFALHFNAMPWNIPERTNFATVWWQRVLLYVMKCIPILRGGDRGEIALVLGKLRYITANGGVVLIFPEGGRSRSGRVDDQAATYGVGRIVKATPGCRVLCVYMRGQHQDGYTDMPAKGERFNLSLRCFEPKSDRGGMRGTVDISRQVLKTLVSMEEEYFLDRE